MYRIKLNITLISLSSILMILIKLDKSGSSIHWPQPFIAFLSNSQYLGFFFWAFSLLLVLEVCHKFFVCNAHITLLFPCTWWCFHTRCFWTYDVLYILPPHVLVHHPQLEPLFYIFMWEIRPLLYLFVRIKFLF